MDMIKIPYSEMASVLKKKLLKHGVPETDAATSADVITANTCDGVLSHGAARVSRLISQIDAEEINTGAQFEPDGQNGACERWNGNSGIGIINALAATDRAMEIADRNGIGLVALKNNTHWLRAGYYGWHAADRGFALICWTNTTANLHPWGSGHATIGNNPFVIAVPRQGGHFVLDMAMSQFSYGALGEYARSGRELPVTGGWNSSDELTTDPAEILETSHLLPTGFWKGSAMSIVLDLLAASLSEGSSTNHITAAETNISQIFLAIKMDEGASAKAGLFGAEIAGLLEKEDKARYPGQRVLETRNRNLREGIPLPEALWNEILSL